VVKEGSTAKASNTYNDFQNLNLGGQTEAGRDAVNDLSYLCLEVTSCLRLPQPQVSVLISEKTPERFWLKPAGSSARVSACRLSSTRTKRPSPCSTRAKPCADARRGGINGCVEPVVPGKDMMASSGYFNLVKCLELALNNGVNPLTGTQLGPQTGVDSTAK
jgi:trans-4-hydroxy-L-proline dehydratase